LLLGTGDDLQIYHDGSDSYVSQTGTGNLIIQGNASNNIAIRTKSGEEGINLIPDGAVELYHNNSKKFETVAGGVKTNDNNYMGFGNSNDLQISHDGSNSRILSLTGELQIFTHNFRVLNDAGNEIILQGAANGSVELFYNNVKQLNTHPNGIFIRGVYPSADNSFSIGSGSERFTTVFATNGSINTSDKTEKNTIVESDLGLDFVNKLKPISFKWNKDDGKTHYGLIAQDVEETITSLGKSITDFGGISKEEDSPMGLGYCELISPLIKAIQELSAEVAALKAGWIYSRLLVYYSNTISI